MNSRNPPLHPTIRFTGPGPTETTEQELARLRAESPLLRGQLQQMGARIEEVGRLFARLKAEPGVTLPVVGRDGDRVYVFNGGPSALDLELPRGLGGEREDIQPGDFVRCHPQTNAILGVVGNVPWAGDVRSVVRVLGDGRVEVSTQVGTSVVHGGRRTIDVGDRVVLDMTGAVVAANLGKPPPAHAFEGDTGVTWDDVRGQDEAKRALREAIEEPYEHRDLYAAFGKRAARGILLEGPPGCGKTLLGKAAATAIAQRHGATAKASGFIYVAGPEILNRWVGASEAGVRELFAAGRRHAAEHGYPAILFLDECDALMGARGGGALGLEGMERTIVPAFLTQMDGLSPQSAIVLLATNRADKLDPAITRDQRIDVKVEVRRPTQTETADIASLYLGRLPVDGDAAAVAADLAAQPRGPRSASRARCSRCTPAARRSAPSPAPRIRRAPGALRAGSGAC